MLDRLQLISNFVDFVHLATSMIRAVRFGDGASRSPYSPTVGHETQRIRVALLR
jgi:hypothetical protein